jgi:hypothetical protein
LDCINLNLFIKFKWNHNRTTLVNNLPNIGISLNAKTVINDIHKYKSFEKEGVFLKKWDSDNRLDEEKYIGCLTHDEFKYIGVLNTNLRRDMFGLNKYENNDTYFGNYDKEAKSSHGIYLYAPKTVNGFEEIEIYHGYWQNNKKHLKGIYIWKKEKTNNQDYNKCDFEAYVGEFEYDNYKKGVLLSKQADHYYIYYGGFDQNGNKNDNKAFYYYHNDNKVVIGKVVDNKLISGYIVYFENDTERIIKQICYIVVSSKGKVEQVKYQDEISAVIRKETEGQAFEFREAYFSIDPPSDIYNQTKKVVQVITTITDHTMFDNQHDYPKYVDLAAFYNDNYKLYQNIKTAVHGIV